MVARSAKVERSARELGKHLRDWRIIHGVTAELMSERAGISRGTLHAIESGSATVRLENVLAVMRLVGVLDGVLAATDPQSSEWGRARTTAPLPQRVRR